MVLTDRGRRQHVASRLAHPGDPAWMRALFIAPAVVGSFAALLLLGRRRPTHPPVARITVDALDDVRTTVLGQTSRRVTALFGPPPAATSSPTQTWYYPLAEFRRTAMAISFADDRAVRVEFFTAPS